MVARARLWLASPLLMLGSLLAVAAILVIKAGERVAGEQPPLPDPPPASRSRDA